MPSSVAPGAVETESKWAENSTASSIRRAQLENVILSCITLTFGPIVSAVNFHENICSLEIHNSCVVYDHGIHECRVRVDIILDVDKIVSSCYFS